MSNRNIFEKNLGTLDRFVRIILAFTLFYLMDFLDDDMQLYMGIVGALLLFSAMKGFCILYLPLKISTAKKSEF